MLNEANQWLMNSLSALYSQHLFQAVNGFRLYSQQAGHSTHTQKKT